MSLNGTISVVLIVRDSSATIEKCLSSFKNIADEIVVVDTGSVDNTIEIVQKYTDKIFHFKWVNDFSAARNFSFDQCTCSHILWVDSDDYILPEDIQKIKEFDLSDKEIVICPYQYGHDEFGNSTCTVYRERIVKRSLGLKWVGPIHETLPLNGKVDLSDISTHHDKQSSSSERNLRILEIIVNKTRKQHLKNARVFYYLGKEFFDVGRYPKAIELFNEYLKMGDGWWEDRYNAYYYLAKCYFIKDDEEKFKKYVFKSIEIEERRAEPYSLLGQWYFNKKEWSKAIHWYEVCITLKRPRELLATYYPEHYTWLPFLQLAVAYNGLGDIKKAYECNEKVIEYRPTDSRALSNRAILLEVLNKKKDGEGKRLNLGCGGKPMEGYWNVDLFKAPHIQEQFEIDTIPYQDNTIAAINSEHSLEHLPFDKIQKTLHEWYRCLRPGGELILKLPDLELCCQGYLNHPISHQDFFKTKAWFKATIFGIQKSQAGEPDEAQFHRSGFGKDEIRMLLEERGFILDYLENYDGFSTPSIGTRAVKPVSAMKVAWVAPINWDAAQTRIRVLNIDRWLRSRGYYSKVCNYPEIINQNYSVAIVGKAFDVHHYQNIKMLKQYGKTVFCDLCESILKFPWVSEILAICDKVICCSDTLADEVREINPNVVVIEDAYET